MPKRTGVRGKVQATKPLSYQGKLIQNFWIEFEEGKAVRWHAEEEEAALASLIQFDEGSAYLGEVALIDVDTLHTHAVQHRFLGFFILIQTN